MFYFQVPVHVDGLPHLPIPVLASNTTSQSKQSLDGHVFFGCHKEGRYYQYMLTHDDICAQNVQAYNPLLDNTPLSTNQRSQSLPNLGKSYLGQGYPVVPDNPSLRHCFSHHVLSDPLLTVESVDKFTIPTLSKIDEVDLDICTICQMPNNDHAGQHFMWELENLDYSSCGIRHNILIPDSIPSVNLYSGSISHISNTPGASLHGGYDK